MSVDLSIYTPRTTPPSHAAIAAAMREQGWVVQFGYGERNLDLRSDGELADDALIWGWFLDVSDAGQNLLSLQAKNKDMLQQLYENGRYGTCGVWITTDFSPQAYLEETEMGDLPQKIATPFAATRQHWVLRTRAGRTATSIALQYTLWLVLGRLSGAVLEDPQEDKWLLPEDVPGALRTVPHSAGELQRSLQKSLKRLEAMRGKGGLPAAKGPIRWFDLITDAAVGVIAIVFCLATWHNSLFSIGFLVVGLLYCLAAVAKYCRLPWANYLIYAAWVLFVLTQIYFFTSGHGLVTPRH